MQSKEHAKLSEIKVEGILRKSIKLRSDPYKLAELQIIEKSIESLNHPDFGFGSANFLLSFDSKPRNWDLLTGIVCTKDKYGWLKNHIELAKLQREHAEALKQEQESYLQLKNRKKTVKVDENDQDVRRVIKLKCKQAFTDIVQANKVTRAFYDSIFNSFKKAESPKKQKKR
jgi:hypothetical protein